MGQHSLTHDPSGVNLVQNVGMPGRGLNGQSREARRPERRGPVEEDFPNQQRGLEERCKLPSGVRRPSDFSGL